MKRVRIATRATPLALVQAERVVMEIKKVFPEIDFEFIKIKTSGDVNLWANLTSNEEFFTKEIDDLILNGKAELAVHSLKDTSVKRPNGIIQVAFLKRDDPRDVIIFDEKFFNQKPSEKLALDANRKLVIGTSSPRRGELVPKFIENTLDIKAEIEIKPIRGTVETRLSKIGNGGGYDASIFAIAGIDRLIKAGNQHVIDLLKDKRCVVLPLTVCPPAPGQGVIVVEILADSPLFDLMRKVNHEPTERDVLIERDFLKKLGGGCHQKFGIISMHSFGIDLQILAGKNLKGEDVSKLIFRTCLKSNDLQSIFHKIRDEERTLLDVNEHHRREFYEKDKQRVDFRQVLKSPEYGTVFDTGDYNLFEAEAIHCKFPKDAQNVFVSHANAVNSEEIIHFLKGKNVWVSGINTWEKLTKLGVFVNGCFDGIGIEIAKKIACNSFVSLENFLTLTHEGALRSENDIATYRLRNLDLSPEIIHKMKSSKFIMWKSISHFELLSRYCLPSHQHLCVEGKTKTALDKIFKNVISFPTYFCYLQWRKDSNSHFVEAG